MGRTEGKIAHISKGKTMKDFDCMLKLTNRANDIFESGEMSRLSKNN